MIQRRWQLFFVFLFFMHGSFQATAETGSISLQEALETRGTVVMFRHALAPGFGDPSNFQVNDCSTQRNLDARGREQSTAIGIQFKKLGFSTATVYSSPWCRCLETAQLMDIGPVTAFDGLGSFFEGHVDRSQTLKQLSNQLASIARTKDKPVVMVTHQVVISAVTKLGTSSGEAILYDPSNDQARRIQLSTHD
jgi:broad specificity phosphatase PhoE